MANGGTGISIDVSTAIAALNDAEDAIAKGIQAALVILGNEMVNGAREIVPVDTGRLRDSIRILSQLEESVTVGTDVPYAPYVEYGCFFNKNFRILTKRGWVRYLYLKIGDEVYTHKQRWRKVTDKFSHVIPQYTWRYTIKTDNPDEKIGVTGNHPILTNRGWVRADELLVGDVIMTVHNDLPRFHWRNFHEHPHNYGTAKTVERICAVCSKVFLVEQSVLKFRKAKYCSPQCCYSTRKNNKAALGKRWNLSEEQKTKRRGQNNPMFNEHRRHYYSDIGYRNDLGHRVKSTWEANFARILRYLNIRYRYESDSFAMKNGSTYTPDFKITDELYIEIKGYSSESWKKKIEDFRNQYPSKHLILIDETRYNPLTTGFASKIPEREFGGASVEGRKLKIIPNVVTDIIRSASVRTTVYNFSVEEDESYVSNYIITHNTRKMDAQPFLGPQADKMFTRAPAVVAEEIGNRMGD